MRILEIFQKECFILHLENVWAVKIQIYYHDMIARLQEYIHLND